MYNRCPFFLLNIHISILCTQMGKNKFRRRGSSNKRDPKGREERRRFTGPPLPGKLDHCCASAFLPFLTAFSTTGATIRAAVAISRPRVMGRSQKMERLPLFTIRVR